MKYLLRRSLNSSMGVWMISFTEKGMSMLCAIRWSTKCYFRSYYLKIRSNVNPREIRNTFLSGHSKNVDTWSLQSRPLRSSLSFSEIEFELGLHRSCIKICFLLFFFRISHTIFLFFAVINLVHEGFFIFDGCPDGLQILPDGSVIQQFRLLSRASLNGDTDSQGPDYIFRIYKKMLIFKTIQTWRRLATPSLACATDLSPVVMGKI